MLNLDALFSDGTENYRIPCEPDVNDVVTIRFRTAKNDADSVRLIAEGNAFDMTVKEQDGLFAYYETRLTIGEKPCFYYFEITKEGEIWYYNRWGVSQDIKTDFHFQITPGFKTPDWAKGAVFYQIFVDRFYNGDKSNDVVDQEYKYLGKGVVKVKDWYEYPKDPGEFYGGDLAGIIEKLDYLKDLGIEAVYLNPIFVSPSNHKYDTQDYDFVDPHFGVIIEDEEVDLGDNETLIESDSPTATENSPSPIGRYRRRITSKKNLTESNKLLIKLVEEAHKKGIRVVLDGVFNHCGSFHKWMDREGIYEGLPGYDKGAYLDKNSPYRNYFSFGEEAWPFNASYDGWWGHNTLPKLNYDGSTELYEYIMNIGRKWVCAPFCCDGWRLDVAADLGYSRELNHRFYQDFRKNVKEANPEAIILAEHYGDPKEWLKGNEWDTIMNYDAFMEPLTWFLTGMEKHSDQYKEYMLNRDDIFFETMRYHMSRLQTTSLMTAMNELSNHDHSRFLTRTIKKVGRSTVLGPEQAEKGINKGVFRAAVTVQMTWIGAPTIYYGDEAGVCGFTDPDNRRTYPWGKEDMDLLQFHKDIIGIHKSFKALRTGSLLFLNRSYGFISYGRFNREEKFVIAVNNNPHEITINIDAWKIGVIDGEPLSRLILTTEEGYSLDTACYYTEKGVLKLTMPPVSSLIIKNVY